MPQKRKVRIQNERIKLAAGAFNTFSLAIMISAIVYPLVRSGDAAALFTKFTWIWFSSGVALHLIAHWILGLLKSED